MAVVASDRGVFVEDPAGRVPVLNPRKQEITVDLIDRESPRFLR